uniref:Transthyretin/hydroxyisourate hydrolase domain-containing protein n=1 Tax=Setaria digitata TaxID=48799 RepID=A0A915Q3K6_9BILA
MRQEAIVLFLVLLPEINAINPVRSMKIGRKQSAAVKGVLICNGKPAVNVKVKLCNHGQDGNTEDFMDEGKTDSEGRFLLKGHQVKITNINPILKVYHNCDEQNAQCLKKIVILIPNDFVSKSLEPTKTFDIGTFNLAGKFAEEGRECIN